MDFLLMAIAGIVWFIVAPLLGVIGFLQARIANGEIRQLRRELSFDGAGAEAAPTATRGFAQPTPSEIRPEMPQSAPLAAQPIAPPSSEPSPTEPASPEPASPEPASLEPSSVEPSSVEPAPIREREPREVPRGPDIESMLTMRWGVWLGAVALLFAALFLIRYAADQGMLGPITRCCAAALLGAALLAAAERLRRRDPPPIAGPFAVDQAPGALAAGGVAALFAAAYGAGPFYGLLSPMVGFAGMAAAAFLAMAASLRFGPLTAAVGIVGAFASPALVATPSPSMIGLFAYLAVATEAAHAVVRRTAWTWLGWAVTIGGAAWVVIAASEPLGSDLWAVATFVPLAAFLGLRLPAVALDTLVGRQLAWGQFAIMAGAGLWLDVMAPGLAPRAALLALFPLAVAKAIGEERLDRMPWLAAGCGLVALWIWNGTGSGDPFEVFTTLARLDLAREPGTMLGAAFLCAAICAATGLLGESRAARPPRWAALVAVVPVLALAACYAEVGRLEADARWSLLGLVLSLLLMMASYRAIRRDDRPTAGVHAAGSVAALALGFTMSLHDQWLSTALALTLPGLAWIEAKVELPALRFVALATGLVTFAILSYWLPYDLAYGHRVVAEHAFITYAIPAMALALAAHVFRRRADDPVVALLESGAMIAAALFVVLEIRLWFGHGELLAPLGFDEITALMLAAAAQAYAYHRIGMRTRRRTMLVARGLLGGLAYSTAAGLLLANPLVTDVAVGAVPLLFAYLVPGVASVLMAREARDPVIRSLLNGYGVVAGVLWTTLQVRLWFHPDALGLLRSPVLEAELWTWSGVWLIDGCAILGLGIALRNQRLRLVGLALVGLVCAKVFLIDMAALTGLWRVASFLGLGLTLIGLSAIHRRFVLPRQSGEAPA